MTYDTSNSRGRSLLTDYSRFKADVRPLASSQGESRPRLPSANYSRYSRSRSGSRSRASCNLDLKDEQARLGRLYNLEQQVHRIEIEVEAGTTIDQHDSDPSMVGEGSIADPFGMDDDDEDYHCARDSRMVQSEVHYSHRRANGSDTSLSLGLLDLEDDDDEDDLNNMASRPRAMDVSDPGYAHRSLPMLGLQQQEQISIPFHIRRSTKRMSQSGPLSDFNKEAQDTGRARSSLQSTRSATDDIRNDLNKALLSARDRKRSSSSSRRSSTGASPAGNLPPRSRTLPENLLLNVKNATMLPSTQDNSAATLPPTMGRSKSLGTPSSRRRSSMDMADNRSKSPIRVSATTPRRSSMAAGRSKSPLRRFRRQRNSTAAATSEMDSWHNSTGKLDFFEQAQKQQQQKRRPIRKCKSNVGGSPAAAAENSGIDPKQGYGFLPPKSKTISYTTTHGKNRKNAGKDTLGTSNHGFLTGSRIKRTFHNPDV